MSYMRFDEPGLDEGEAKKKNPQVVCPHCNAEVSKGFLKSHQRRPDCTALRNAKAMKARGYVELDDSFLEKICRQAAANIQAAHPGSGTELLRVAETCVEKGVRYGAKKRLTTRPWAKAWVPKLFDVGYAYRFYEGHDMGHAVLLYGKLVAECALDPERLAGVEAIKALSGLEGMRSLVFTATVRATKLREEAAKLDAQALKLRTEADQLDPPLQPDDGA